MSETDHYQNNSRKELSSKEEIDFNKATNEYIKKLSNIDPVLAGVMKSAIIHTFGSLDYQTYEGTYEELNTYLNDILPETSRQTGFCKLKPVSAKLAHWLNIESNKLVTVPELTASVWKELKKRNLIDQEDKRVFRVDQEAAELFGLNMEKTNASTSHMDPIGFNFCNLQTYIAHANKID